MSGERDRRELLLTAAAEGSAAGLNPRDYTEKLLAEAADGTDPRSNARDHTDLFINAISGGGGGPQPGMYVIQGSGSNFVAIPSGLVLPKSPSTTYSADFEAVYADATGDHTLTLSGLNMGFSTINSSFPDDYYLTDTADIEDATKAVSINVRGNEISIVLAGELSGETPVIVYAADMVSWKIAVHDSRPALRAFMSRRFELSEGGVIRHLYYIGDNDPERTVIQTSQFDASENGYNIIFNKDGVPMMTIDAGAFSDRTQTAVGQYITTGDYAGCISFPVYFEDPAQIYVIMLP